MPELTVRTGQDTYALEAEPANSKNAQSRFLKIRSGDELIPLIYLPVNATRLADKTITSAILSIPVEANWVTQTVTIQALAADWKVARVNYGNMPAVTGPTANSGATGALSAGSRFQIDVTSLVQNIADGDPNYGWKLTTSQTTDASQIRGFDSGYSSFTLTVEFVDQPDAPTQLAPEGIIGLAKPVVTVDDYDELAAIEVQVDATPSGTNADYDSGWVATTRPKLDLSALTTNSLPASQGNAGTFDTDATGWVGSNCAVARVTTPTQAGAGSLRLTASSAADMYAASSASAGSMVPVTPGQTYHVEGYSRAASTGRSTRAEIQWYDASAVALSVTTGTPAANSSGAWGLREVSGVAPAGAAYMRPRGYVIAPASAEIHYWDTFKVNAGTTNYAGLTDGASTYWRARVKLLDGGISNYSSWAAITRDDKPAIVMDNPSSTAIWDPTPVIAAHLSPAGDANTRWQVIVADVADPSDVRYNSGDAISGATLSHAIPLRNYKGVKVFPNDGTYRLEVRAWDRSDRVPSQGDTAFARTVINVVLSTDGAVTAPGGFTATAQASSSAYPGVLLHWTRAADPDWFVVRRDGEFLAIVDTATYRISPGVWEWTDYTAEPNVSHAYTVRAVTDVAGVKKSSASSSTANVSATVRGVWLRSDFGDVLINGLPDAAQVEKSQSFEMPYRAENVDIVTASGGIEGTLAGTIDRRVNLTTSRAILEQLRLAPATDVRMVWGTHNIWVHLKALSITMSPESVLPSAPMYDVKFGFSEIAPRD